SPGRSSAVGSGESMAPVYGDSTLLVIAKVEFDQLQAGMTVAYQNFLGRRVVHQLLESTSSGWRVQGLNNETADRERVTRENLIGVVYASLASDSSDQ
ncbi:MAG TPA: S24/S26 family peptidase, partial [Opitutaceae bacterium]|nr:S24/S26 family peptidase [Opitutaceae bacterium]